MLLRVYVDRPEQFANWIAEQQKSQPEIQNQGGLEIQLKSGNGAGQKGLPPNSTATRKNTAYESASLPQAIDAYAGQFVFEQEACINCHTVAGTVANGRYGPDLTHLMARSTLAAGAISILPTTWMPGSAPRISSNQGH